MASQQLPPSGHAAPRSGGRILQFQQPWLDRVLDGSKTLEIRGSSTTPRGAWLSANRRIQGWARVAISVYFLLDHNVDHVIASQTISGHLAAKSPEQEEGH